MNSQQHPALAAKTLSKALWDHGKPADILQALALRNWLAFSEESLAAAAQELEQHWSVRHEYRILNWGSGVLTLLCLALCANFYVDASALTIAQQVGLTLLFGGLVGFTLSSMFMHFIVMPLLQRGRPELLRLLSPANREPFLCASAVDFVEKFEEVRQYRDQVVAGGRALRVMDLDVLRRLGYQAREQAQEQSQHAMCQRLHGLALDTGN